jgi:hypothetical protein
MSDTEKIKSNVNQLLTKRIKRRTLIGYALASVTGITGVTPAFAKRPLCPTIAPTPILPADENKKCPEFYSYSKTLGCVSHIGACNDHWYYCEGHKHPKFVCDPPGYFKKPGPHCCRVDTTVPKPGGKGRARCWRFKAHKICPVVPEITPGNITPAS